MITNPKECKCEYHTVEYVEYGKDSLAPKEHYYECWICNKKIQHNPVKHKIHLDLELFEQEYLEE